MGMNSDSDLEIIASELDAFRAVAEQAYRNRDIDSYRDMFTEDLQYVQPDGARIDRSTLMKDVRLQFAQFKSIETTYTRESLALNDD